MSIFDRLSSVVQSNLNSLLDQAEDPGKLIAQTIIDMEREVKEAKKELIATLGSAKRLEKEADAFTEESADWESKAVLALKQGDDALARAALKQKMQVSKKADASRQRAADVAIMADKMRDGIENAEAKIEDLRARQNALAGQLREARKPAGETTMSGGGAFARLERMTNQIDQLDAELEVQRTLQGDGMSEAELRAKFRSLERDGADAEVDDELAALKEKLNG